jgi:hypothetical protein
MASAPLEYCDDDCRHGHTQMMVLLISASDIVSWKRRIPGGGTFFNSANSWEYLLPRSNWKMWITTDIHLRHLEL